MSLYQTSVCVEADSRQMGTVRMGIDHGVKQCTWVRDQDESALFVLTMHASIFPSVIDRI